MIHVQGKVASLAPLAEQVLAALSSLGGTASPRSAAEIEIDLGSAGGCVVRLAHLPTPQHPTDVLAWVSAERGDVTWVTDAVVDRVKRAGGLELWFARERSFVQPRRAL